MANSSFRARVEEVLGLLREHSKKNRALKPATAMVGRLFGWLPLVGGLIFFGAEVLRQVDGLNDPFLQVVWLSLAISGLLIFFGGVVAALVEIIRTTSHPFDEQVDQIVDAFDREYELIDALRHFEAVTLEFARQRLQLQSTRVAARLSLIGGSAGLKTSFVGVAILMGAMFFQYEPIIDGWTVKTWTFLGVALLLGLSIGGLFVRYGTSQADYYSGIIGLALQRKAWVVKPRKVFQMR